jgi:dynein heavy chain
MLMPDHARGVHLINTPRRYMAVETDVSAIAGVHNIGALSLETLPLKTSLKAEAASWKAQFALNLHKQGSEDLKAFDTYIRWDTVGGREQGG